MPLLSLPADVILEIFSYMDTGNPLLAASPESGTSTLATVSLVCKQLCALARRPLLRSLRWCDKTKTSLNLNQWQRNLTYANSLHVPKKLVVAVEFDFEAQSLDAVSCKPSIYVPAERSVHPSILSGASISSSTNVYTPVYRALARSVRSSSATRALVRNTYIRSSCQFQCYDPLHSSTSTSLGSPTTTKQTTLCPPC